MSFTYSKAFCSQNVAIRDANYPYVWFNDGVGSIQQSMSWKNKLLVLTDWLRAAIFGRDISQL